MPSMMMETRIRAVEYLVACLSQTTATGVAHLFGDPVEAPGLLTGPGVERLWIRYTRDRPRRQPMGLYGYFSTIDSHWVPVYLGKGAVLDRGLSHLAPHRFVDEVLALLLGGIPHHLEQLADAQRARVSRGLEQLHFGFAFSGPDEPALARREKRLQQALCPVADGWCGVKHWQVGYTFDLDRLARAWLADYGPKAIDIGPVDQACQDMLQRHQAVFTERVIQAKRRRP